MSDIVERLLRNGRLGPDRHEAADIIEALRRELEDIKQAHAICPICAQEIDKAAGVDVAALKQELAAMTQERDDEHRVAATWLRTAGEFKSQLIAMTAERDELAGANILNRNAVQFQKDKLAASQAREQQLRGYARHKKFCGMFDYVDVDQRHCTCGLDAIPSDDTALKQYGAKLLRDAAKKLDKWNADRVNRMADELLESKP